MSEPLPSLPQVLIDEILVRLPVKSIGRFRCVSKQWKSDLSTRRFAKVHLNYINPDDPETLIWICQYNEAPRLIQTDICLLTFNTNKESISSEDGVFRKIEPSLKEEIKKLYLIDVGGSCHGLVLLWAGTFDEHGVFLMNPITLEYERVHDSVGYNKDTFGLGYRFASYGLCYDESEDDYKIVSLIAGENMRYGKDESVDVDIYSFKTKNWKRTSFQNCFDREFRMYTQNFYSGLFVSGCLHWVVTYWIDIRVGRYKILSFNLGREEFQVVAPPCAIESNFEGLGFEMRVLGGCLAIIAPKINDIDVWVMKEYGVRDSWTKLTFTYPESFYFGGVVLLLSDFELVLKSSDKPFIMIDSRKGVSKDLAVVGVPKSLNCTQTSVMGAFRGSLVSPNNLT